jgi:hypothetical protein
MRKGKGKQQQQSSYPPNLTEDSENGFELGRDDDDDDDDDDDEEEDDVFAREGQALIGGLEATRVQLAEATREGEEGINLNEIGGESSEGGGITPWAHRDIKPVRNQTTFFSRK